MNWATLIYQIPEELQKSRMVVWRKLKMITALNVLQSIWILPESKDAEFVLKSLEKRINEDGAKSVYCVTVIEDDGKNQKLISCFNGERKQDYKKFIDKCNDFEQEIRYKVKANYTYTEVKKDEREIKKLHKWLNKIIKRDYFDCSLKFEAIGKLEKSEELFNRLGIPHN